MSEKPVESAPKSELATALLEKSEEYKSKGWARIPSLIYNPILALSVALSFAAPSINHFVKYKNPYIFIGLLPAAILDCYLLVGEARNAINMINDFDRSKQFGLNEKFLTMAEKDGAKIAKRLKENSGNENVIVKESLAGVREIGALQYAIQSVCEEDGTGEEKLIKLAPLMAERAKLLGVAEGLSLTTDLEKAEELERDIYLRQKLGLEPKISLGESGWFAGDGRVASHKFEQPILQKLEDKGIDAHNAEKLKTVGLGYVYAARAEWNAAALVGEEGYEEADFLARMLALKPIDKNLPEAVEHIKVAQKLKPNLI